MPANLDDPITLRITWDRLVSISEEAAATLRGLNGRAERAETVARRLAAVAGRRAQRAAQGSLF